MQMAVQVRKAVKGVYALLEALQSSMRPAGYLAALVVLAGHPVDRVRRRALHLFADTISRLSGSLGNMVRTSGATTWLPKMPLLWGLCLVGFTTEGLAPFSFPVTMGLRACLRLPLVWFPFSNSPLGIAR